MAFRVKFPKTYTSNPTKKFPVMLFLHGAGEAGCNTNGGIYNNEKQLWLGGQVFMQRVDNNEFDGFLLYPQLVTTADCWGVWFTAPAAAYKAVFSMIDSLAKYARADIDRLLITGLSGGGFAAWRVASEYPQRVAKIMPSAGVGSTSNRAAFVHIPIWFATGGKDPDPSPAQADYALSQMKAIGADIRYTRYPDLGHNMWYNHWKEKDFPAAMNDMHKANPLIFFQKSDYCAGEAINTKLGITAGFYAYEWQKDNVTIATRTNGVNKIVISTSIISYTGNEITVKAFGTYRVRFKRSSSAAWSAWSPKPAVIKQGAPTQAPPIQVVGVKSKVLPALDNATTVPLTMPAGYINYEWRRTTDNVKVSSVQTYNAPVGTYKAKYEVRAGCGPGFSPNFVVVNANGSPKPAAATSLKITSLSTTSIRLDWTQGSNETGFEVYRGTVKGGPYQMLALTAANATTYTDNTLATNTTYYYVVRAVNGTGAAAKSNEVSPNNGNTAPVVPTLSDMHVKTGATASKTFTVTDNAGDVVTVSIPLKPAFVTLTKLSATSYRINAAPTGDDVGFNTIKVVAADNKGMSTTKTFNILVTNKNTRSVFVNIGASGKSAPAPWNNWLGTRAANSVIGSLKDESSVTTAFSITTVSAWSTYTTLGHITGDNSGVVPDAVLTSGIADNGGAKQIRFGGLSTSKRYNIIFVGSKNEGVVATTQYASGTQTSVLDARYNTQRTANLNGLVPASNGQILVTATRTGGAPYSFLNAIIIEEYSPAITLLEPENLFVEPVDRTSVQLTWSDKTNNESASGGYQLQRATNATFTTGLVTITLNGNITSYKNTGLAANTKYYYRVRAKSGSTYSAFSNKVATITPYSIIYVNFNTTVANGPAPWNNLVASPMAPFTSANLKNQSNSTTTVKLKLEKVFNGEFTAGVSTGNNSGVAPDNVLKSDFWIDNGQLAQFRVTGLNKSHRYRFGFFGSSSSNGWFKGDYTASYSINGRTVYLNSWMNSTKIVYIGDVLPNSAGEVLLDFSTSASADWGFNGGVLIEDYSDSQGGVVLNSVLDETSDSLALQNIRPAASVYPNPFNDAITINFQNTSSNSNVTAELYDVYGRLILGRNFNNLPAGVNNLVFTIGSEKTQRGIYFLSLKVNDKVFQTIKMVRY
jgi:pimeloyl-ACP methyl ester carboxylesterase/fibronectin type 3 domain-containing protein